MSEILTQSGGIARGTIVQWPCYGASGKVICGSFPIVYPAASPKPSLPCPVVGQKTTPGTPPASIGRFPVRGLARPAASAAPVWRQRWHPYDSIKLDSRRNRRNKLRAGLLNLRRCSNWKDKKRGYKEQQRNQKRVHGCLLGKFKGLFRTKPGRDIAASR